jgi:uncharacterized membrane protein
MTGSSRDVTLALTGTVTPAASSITGAAYTSCGCSIHVHHVIQSWTRTLWLCPLGCRVLGRLFAQQLFRACIFYSSSLLH